MANNFAAVQREIVAEIDGMSGPAAQARIAEFAAARRDEIVAKDHPSSVRTYVDGREDAPLASVRPAGGVIRFDFSYLENVVRQIFWMLVTASPYRSKRPGADPATHYKDEHLVFVNDIEVDGLPDKLPAGAVVTIVNLQPYSRKIEAGHSLQAPSGVYEATAKLAKREFGKQAEIKFAYREFPGQGPVGPKTRQGGTATHRHDDRFPAITISEKEF